ncbi:TetR/AcrR family transcriptional regulator [Dethiosulfovibrio salsuginis]|uniref:Transcriptional regulator, TetR family n=1 Tax=Dethiosulfovibrio salsuginis TaxID=561720 RepID=A0A1X7J6H4_9BACT|nr:TetR/AcrR family transcriptional regulator [Dethiosulfovibrio salsuginis]SMG23285.1 transcriptional regulator, TetR family [Dethiosulfovibrio salsuginis]
MIEREGRDVRGDILGSARRLFLQDGYDRVSVDRVIQDAGASKGSFYHYFQSKADLADELVREMLAPVYRQIGEIAESNLDGLSKLNQAFRIAYQWKSDNAKMLKFIVRSFWSDSNLLVRHKMKSWSMKKDKALLAGMLGQGMEEGTFAIEDPEDVAELIVHLGTGIGESMAALFVSIDDSPDKIELMERKVKLFERTLDCILGVPKGTVKTFDMESLKVILAEGVI